jgi:hypothetical protein
MYEKPQPLHRSLLLLMPAPALAFQLNSFITTLVTRTKSQRGIIARELLGLLK